MAASVRSLLVTSGGLSVPAKSSDNEENLDNNEISALAHDHGLECIPAWWDEMQGCPDSVATVGVLLPFLTSLERLSMNSGLWELSSLTPPPGSSNLTHLSLTGIGMPPSSLASILALSRVIKTLELHWYSDHHIWRNKSGSPLADLDAALLPSSASLNDVSLTYTRADVLWKRAHDQGRLRVPRILSRLKSLKVATAFMYRVPPSGKKWRSEAMPPLPDKTALECCLVNMLPPGLETLHIVRHTKEDFGVLLTNIRRLLAATTKGEFPALRSITIERIRRTDNSEKYTEEVKKCGVAFQAIVKDLTQLGEGHGIRMRWATRYVIR